MRTQIETRLSDQLARYLDLAVSQVKLTAANMANLDTPGYRTLDMNFEGQMREALDDVENECAPRAIRVSTVGGLIARPDGNDVSMDRESLKLAESQLKFKTGVALLRTEYQRVMDAIHGDGK